VIKPSIHPPPAASSALFVWRRWRLPVWVNRVNLPLARHLAAGVIIAAVWIGGSWYTFNHVDEIEDAANVWLLAHRGVSNDTSVALPVTLPGNSEVELDPGSHMWSILSPRSIMPVVKLQGAATVTVTDFSGPMSVMTEAGAAYLTPGQYRIAMEDSRAMQVTVDSGLAVVRKLGAEVGVALRPGQHARVTR